MNDVTKKASEIVEEFSDAQINEMIKGLDKVREMSMEEIITKFGQSEN